MGDDSHDKEIRDLRGGEERHRCDAENPRGERCIRPAGHHGPHLDDATVSLNQESHHFTSLAGNREGIR